MAFYLIAAAAAAAAALSVVVELLVALDAQVLAAVELLSLPVAVDALAAV
jgi:hypothetical protein